MRLLHHYPEINFDLGNMFYASQELGNGQLDQSHVLASSGIRYYLLIGDYESDAVYAPASYSS
jgi:hypothetical protein